VDCKAIPSSCLKTCGCCNDHAPSFCPKAVIVATIV
jgi:hypothetical protein